MHTVVLRALSACGLAILSSCAFGMRLNTEAAPPDDAAGTYHLHLYGCRYPDDVENMALLVDQAAPYRFELFVPDTSYRTKNGLSGPAALKEADAFIRCSQHSLWMTVLRRINDPGGRTVAYELKPLYFPHDVGKDESLLTNYVLKNGVIRAYLRLDPQLERMQNFSNVSSPSGM